MSYDEEDQYLIFVDQRFRKAAIEELKELFPGSELRQNKRYGGEVVLVAAIKKHAAEVASIVKSTSTFIDFAMPINVVLDMVGDAYDEVYDALADILKKRENRSFRIEVKEVDAELADNAKTVEVGLGERLEKAGFNVDLKNPRAIAYVVFMQDMVIIGYDENRAGAGYALDQFRYANREPVDIINRAEFKIKEAVEFFGIDMGEVKKALDVGAAPGGWTHYMSKRDVRIVAVDKGSLDYGRLVEGKRVLVLVDKKEVNKLQEAVDLQGLKNRVKVCAAGMPNLDFSGYDIIHIKANLHRDEEIGVLKKLGKFDMLLIDTNTSPKVSAEIANSLVDVLNPHARLVMTAKLMTMLIDEHVDVVRKGLVKHYEFIKIKKLPHNRREFTVYASLKGISRDEP